MKYEKKIPLLRIRWLTVTCFEIQVGGKTIVTDPFIGLSPGTDMDVDAVEGADLITVTHLHWDHVTDIAPLMDKFGSSVLVGDLSAMDLAKYLNRNPRFLYPMAHNTELDFGWVKVRALMGRHTDAGKPFLDIATAFEQNKHFARYPELAPLEYFAELN